jgi:hypothetical protein
MIDQAEGKVVRLVTDEELLINLGSEQGVREGDTFIVLDERTRNVKEPGTNRDLGSLERVKTRIIVIQVGELMSLAKVKRRSMGLSGAALVLSGVPTSNKLTSSGWPEGVEEGDPVMKMLTAAGGS